MYTSVSILDIERWMGSPAVFVLDCAGAENIIEQWVENSDFGPKYPNWYTQLGQSTKDRIAEIMENEKSSSSVLMNKIANETGAEKSECESFFKWWFSQIRGAEERHETIFLAACGAKETLPLSSEYPADVFTACVTTPIKMSLKWFVSQNYLTCDIDEEFLDILLGDQDISGAFGEKNCPLNELNRIFTSITDGIAWDVLPQSDFYSLFREDQLIASIFRNFLLAERIMSALSRTPVSYPRLPPTKNHPLWEAWDYALEDVLSRMATRYRKAYPNCKLKIEKNVCEIALLPLPNQIDPSLDYAMLEFNMSRTKNFSKNSRKSDLSTLKLELKNARVNFQQQLLKSNRKSELKSTEEKIIQLQAEIQDKTVVRNKVVPDWHPSPFFEHQLKAFEIWLDGGDASKKPLELPIMLQMLLSQSHRLSALKLFARFFDKGRWAVQHALGIDIYPYIQKLLKTTPPADRQIAKETREALVTIWAKTLVYDHRCKQDLAKQQYCTFFVEYLQSLEHDEPNQIVLVCVILSSIANQFAPAQRWFLDMDVLPLLQKLMYHEDFTVRVHILLTLGKIWELCEDAKRACVIEFEIADDILKSLRDPSPEVRAAAVEAISTLFGSTEYDADSEKYAIDLHLGKQVARYGVDASCLVRRQVLHCLGKLFWWQKDEFTRAFKNVGGGRSRRNAHASASLRRVASVPSRMLNSTEESPIFSSIKSDGPDDLPRPPPIDRMYSDSQIPHNLSSPNLDSSSPMVPISPLISPHLPPVPDPSPLLHATEHDGEVPNFVLPSSHDESREFISRVLNRLVYDPHEKISQCANLLRKRVLSWDSTKKRNPERSRSRSSRSTSIHSVRSNPPAYKSPHKRSRVESSPVHSEFLENIETQFFEWCCHKFHRSAIDDDVIDYVYEQMGVEDHYNLSYDVSGSYESIIAKGHKQTEHFKRVQKEAKNWSEQQCQVKKIVETEIFNLKPRTCSQVCFHPYDYVLYTATKNRSTTIQAWDLNHVEAPLNTFTNVHRSKYGSRVPEVSSLCVLNEHYSPILCVGSNDGTVRFWKDATKNEHLITSFQALPHPRRSHSKSPGDNNLHLVWNGDSTTLTSCGCNSGLVCFWDITKEQCVRNFNIEDVKATCLTNLSFYPGVTLVGLDNGSVVMLDDRDPDSIRNIIPIHAPSRVVSVNPHRNIIASASLNGRICFSDPRILRENFMSAAAFQIPYKKMDNFDIHPYAPIMAVKNCDREGIYVSVYSTSNFDVQEITPIRYHRGFLGQRIGPVSTLKFHPHYCILAVGAAELISLHVGNVQQTDNI